MDCDLLNAGIPNCSPRSSRVTGRRIAATRAVHSQRAAGHLHGVAVTLTASAFLLAGDTAAHAVEAANAPTAEVSSGEAKPKLQTVTVEARRQLERQVNHFVASVIVHYGHDALVRWNAKVCPLVAGLPREQGEFMLARISQVAATVGASLDGEHCRANFYVIVTPIPDELLRKWWSRDPTMYSRRNGAGYINAFLNSRLAIRCWYNTTFHSSDGTPLTSDTLAAGLTGAGVGVNAYMAPATRIYSGTRLHHAAVQALLSVIIVVDSNRMQGVNAGQLADYVAMVGLAEIRPDADPGPVPTILQLFRDTKEPPQGLSVWDEAFLNSLYHTNQSSVTQSAAIRTAMLKTIAP